MGKELEKVDAEKVTIKIKGKYSKYWSSWNYG